MKDYLNISLFFRYLTIIIGAFISEFCWAQDSLKKQTISFGVESGITYLAPFDQSYSFSSNIELINHKTVWNNNINLTFDFFKQKKYFPKIKIGTSTFLSKATSKNLGVFQKNDSFKNRYLTLNVILMSSIPLYVKQFSFKLNFGFYGDKTVYVMSNSINLNGSKSNEVDNMKTFRKFSSLNYGTMLGFDHPLKKINLGVYYYQRLYFTGFNREIARVMLRVGF